MYVKEIEQLKYEIRFLNENYLFYKEKSENNKSETFELKGAIEDQISLIKNMELKIKNSDSVIEKFKSEEIEYQRKLIDFEELVNKLTLKIHVQKEEIEKRDIEINKKNYCNQEVNNNLYKISDKYEEKLNHAIFECNLWKKTILETIKYVLFLSYDKYKINNNEDNDENIVNDNFKNNENFNIKETQIEQFNDGIKTSNNLHLEKSELFKYSNFNCKIILF